MRFCSESGNTGVKLNANTVLIFARAFPTFSVDNSIVETLGKLPCFNVF